MSLNSLSDSFIRKSFSYVNENYNENDNENYNENYNESYNENEIYLLRQSTFDNPSVK
jgi:hypothetical protein